MVLFHVKIKHTNDLWTPTVGFSTAFLQSTFIQINTYYIKILQIFDYNPILLYTIIVVFPSTWSGHQPILTRKAIKSFIARLIMTDNILFKLFFCKVSYRFDKPWFKAEHERGVKCGPTDQYNILTASVDRVIDRWTIIKLIANELLVKIGLLYPSVNIELSALEATRWRW